MDCIFCKIIKKEIPSKVLYEDDIVIAFMDINPLCDGHVLIVPKKHYEDIYEVDSDTLNHMFEVAKHLHLHILPDFNKKPTKSIEEVYDLLKED